MEVGMTDSEPGRRERIWRVLAVVAGAYLVLFGGFVVFAGEADDSPGLGGLGLITVAIGLGMLYRTLRR
jgi:hypothetical protein